MRIRVFLTVALLLISTGAWAQNINFKNLTAEQVKNLIEQPGKVLLWMPVLKKNIRRAIYRLLSTYRHRNSAL